MKTTTKLVLTRLLYENYQLAGGVIYVWCLAPNMRDDWSHRFATTHVQSELDDARDGDWSSIQSIAGSILSHCDVSTYGDFVPDDIAEIASDVLADRNVTDDDIDEMLDWYDDSFDEVGEPIYD